jgi:hypothetical protein
MMAPGQGSFLASLMAPSSPPRNDPNSVPLTVQQAQANQLKRLRRLDDPLLSQYGGVQQYGTAGTPSVSAVGMSGTGGYPGNPAAVGYGMYNSAAVRPGFPGQPPVQTAYPGMYGNMGGGFPGIRPGMQGYAMLAGANPGMYGMMQQQQAQQQQQAEEAKEEEAEEEKDDDKEKEETVLTRVEAISSKLRSMLGGSVNDGRWAARLWW